MLIRFKFVKINSLFLENALIGELMNKIIYTISFNCYASCKAFLKKNSVAPNELIEKGNTFIKVDSSFMKQANWINSSYVYQIREEY